jgi:hypothetical protein
MQASFWPPSLSARDAIDLRDGVRTMFYGGRYTGHPPVGDFYGWSMAFGDVDGDGYQDFFASSANAEGPNDESAEHQGDIYLFFGGPRSEVDSIYAVDEPGVPDIVLYRGGWAMACGDIDRDGYDDLILAEVKAQSGVFVVFGAPRDQLRRVYNFDPVSPGYTPPDVHITGAPKLGGNWIPVTGGTEELISLALVTGDLNADGHADIIVGDIEFRGPSDGRVSGGVVYIVFGRPRAEIPPMISVDPASPLPRPDVAIYGESDELYPIHLAIGDLDGDGIDDLLASTYQGSGFDSATPGGGEVHGFWGRPEWKPTYDTQIDAFDFALSGRFLDEFGYRIATGDLDGDGRDELIVGSPFVNLRDIDRRYMGEYRIYFGRPRGLWPKWSDAITMTDVLMIGAHTGDVFGGPQEWIVAFSLATGNRNGDRYSDLLIGAGRGSHPDTSRPGRAYLLFGRPHSAWPAFIDLRDGYDTVIYGIDYTGSPGYQYDLMGATVGMADWDDDGIDELFLAAPFGDGPDNISSDCGEVYVLFSTDSLATSAPSTPRQATAALSNYPNPFNPATTFAYEAPPGVLVSLTVYDARGREVARPLASQTNPAPTGTVRWEARDNSGQPLPSGVYFVKLRAGNESHARKVHLVR